MEGKQIVLPKFTRDIIETKPFIQETNLNRGITKSEEKQEVPPIPEPVKEDVKDEEVPFKQETKYQPSEAEVKVDDFLA